jgi:hypothetical protein
MAEHETRVFAGAGATWSEVESPAAVRPAPMNVGDIGGDRRYDPRSRHGHGGRDRLAWPKNMG